jgi:transcriptional regulator NrdR family protein
MPKITQGGTKIWCPVCKDVQVCRAIPTSSMGEQSGQLWSRKDHDDVRWFRRARRCLKCEYEFLTAEMDEQFITELVKLRKALGDIKANAEQYLTESKSAEDALSNLTKSLSVLRALQVYKNQKS